jgi:transcriptional regulator with XRE-family HTH domain
LAEKSGTTENAISLIESGKRQPRPSTMKKIADALGVPVEDILQDEEKQA